MGYVDASSVIFITKLCPEISAEFPRQEFTPQGILEIMLDILPLEICIKNIDAKSALPIKES